MKFNLHFCVYFYYSNVAIDCGLRLSIVELSRFYRFIQEKLKNVTVMNRADPEVKSTPMLLSPVPVVNLITIRYIFCDNMFGKEMIEPKTTGARFNLDTHTMRNLQGFIAEREGINVSEFAVELFSAEGYPLNVNSFTCQGERFLVFETLVTGML